MRLISKLTDVINFLYVYFIEYFLFIDGNIDDDETKWNPPKNY